ncbi:SGNH/GDSL hydrolase family protein [Herbaspirillum sp. HC18]|nr:SGNH/GDSL hydrolase family protein [Herbaspirillum sp. HC18]
MRGRFVLRIAAYFVAGAAFAGTPHAQAAAGEKQVIEYYGDSTIWGFGSANGERVAKPAPAAFADALPRTMNFEVRNEGVNGSTACELLDGADGRHLPWRKQMAASTARYVIVNFAINDQWKSDIGTYKKCLRSLADIASRQGRQMIFETPNPTRDSGRDGLDVYVNAMKQVAVEEKIPVIDQYKYLTDLLNGQSPYVLCPDGLHPSDQVYILKGNFAAETFARLFLNR